ncbi:MAG: SGNH/GDSL hydrolase family protein [Burkholderiales bacterium]
MHQTSWPEPHHTEALAGKISRSRPWWIAVLLAGLVGVEAIGRLLGLHTPVLYERTSYGFRPAPNQDIRRFGNRIFYDSLGLRSPPASQRPGPETLRILCLGDSVTNGGAITGQADTFPYRLQQALSVAPLKTEVLSASSPGWAIGNEAGWLKQHGTLGAKYLVLTLNSYDLFQTQAPASVLGLHPSFPERPPWLATQELFSRYILPRLMDAAAQDDPGARANTVSLNTTRDNLSGLREIISRARQQNTEVVVLFVDAFAVPAANRSLTVEAKKIVAEFLMQMHVPLVETSDAIEGAGGRALFRDALHPNPKGNEVIAKVIGQYLLSAHQAGQRP